MAQSEAEAQRCQLLASGGNVEAHLAQAQQVGSHVMPCVLYTML